MILSHFNKDLSGDVLLIICKYHLSIGELEKLKNKSVTCKYVHGVQDDAYSLRHLPVRHLSHVLSGLIISFDLSGIWNKKPEVSIARY